jgi:hypothetical protein
MIKAFQDIKAPSSASQPADAMTPVDVGVCIVFQVTQTQNTAQINVIASSNNA